MDCQPIRKRPRIKNDRILCERIEKFISPLYFADVNLFSRLYKFSHKIPTFYHWKAPARVSFDDVPSDRSQFELANLGDSFGPTWSTHWFVIDIDLSKDSSWKNEEVRLRWNSGSEALVWVDGVPMQGLTGGDGPTRTDFILTNCCHGNEKLEVQIEMAANGMFGAGGGGMINPPHPDRSFAVSMCEVAVRSQEISGLMRDLKLIMDMKENLGESSDIGDKALQVGCDVVNLLQSLNKNSVQRAKALLDQFFCKKNGKVSASTYTIHAIGHCHIDSAWLWPYEETERKCGRSWSSVVSLMKRFPDFTFACSQAVQFEWVKHRYPTLHKQIKEMVAVGKFMPTGGTWVEMDGNIPSGEAFIRQFLYGQRFFKKEFGSYCSVFWLPDTFGYSAQLPQIIRKSGIKYFLTQKISWSLINKFPHNSFTWQGIDGSKEILLGESALSLKKKMTISPNPFFIKCLTHFPPADTYESSATFKDVMNTLKNNKDKGIVKDGMLLYGFGDGGGGPTEDMIENVERLGNIDGLPRIEHSSVLDFFTTLEQCQDRLHTWIGELYLELHQGTFTTHAKVKLRNRQCEFLLRDVEIYQVWLFCENKICVSALQLEELWRNILLNQFHDVLPGSSINEVYRDAHQLYDEVMLKCNKMVSEALPNIVESGNEKAEKDLVFFNTLSWRRKSVVKVMKSDMSSANLLTQSLDSDTCLLMIDVPSMGYKTSTQNVNMSSSVSATYDPVKGLYELKNGFLSSAFNGSGQMVSCIFQKSNRECVKAECVGNEFCMYTDIPLYWDAWDVMPYNDETQRTISKCTNIEILSSGPLRVILKFRLEISANSSLVQHVSLDADADFLRFDTEVSWHENRQLLKVQFPINVLSNFATYEIQYGHLQRPTHCNTSWDWAKHEVCGHKWVDISEHNFGAALLNDCKYGFSAYGSTLQMTLLRAPKAPDAEADMGDHMFSYAFMPHEGSFQKANVIQRAYEVNNPIRYYSAKSQVRQKEISLFQVNVTGVIIGALKMCEEREDSIIIRLYECFGGSHSNVLLSSCVPMKRVCRTDLLEDDEHDDPEELKSVDQHTVKFNIKPFEILTLCCRTR